MVLRILYDNTKSLNLRESIISTSIQYQSCQPVFNTNLAKEKPKYLIKHQNIQFTGFSKQTKAITLEITEILSFFK